MRWIVMLLLFVTCSSLTAAPSFHSSEEVGRWITYYYRDPDPDRVPDAIIYLSQSGVFDRKGTLAPMSAFIAACFQTNPDKVDSWVERMCSIQETDLPVVVLGLWYSGLSDSQGRINALFKKYPKLRTDFKPDTDAPTAVIKIPLEKGPWVLDALWGTFMATGDKAPVERIITALSWSEEKKNTMRLLIGGSAQWSLTSNAIQHPLVLKVCEEQLKVQNDLIKIKLQEIITKAKNKLKSKQQQNK